MLTDERYLLGFADFFSADVGADPKKAPPAKPAPGKKPPMGKASPKRVLAKGKQNKDVVTHGRVLRKAGSTLQKSAKTAERARKALARKPVAVSSLKPTGVAAKKAPPIAGKVVKLGEYIGVTAPSGAVVPVKVSPKAQLAVKRHNDAVKKARLAGRKLAQHTVKMRKASQGLARQMVAQRNTMTNMRTGRKKAALGELMGALLNDAEIGAMLLDPHMSEVTAMGVLEYMDALGQGGGLDIPVEDPSLATDMPAEEMWVEEAPAGLSAMDILNSAAELGPAPDLNHFTADSTDPGVPAIQYDGSRGTPDGFAGSLGLIDRSTDKTIEPSVPGIDGTDHFGFIWGKYEWDNPSHKGLKWGNDFPSNTWVHVRGRHGLRGWTDSFAAVPPEEAFTSNSKSSPDAKPYGPLIGNPAMPTFANMRIDGKGKMFWFAQEAPEWLTGPIKAAAKLTEIAAKKLEAEQLKAEQAAEEKDRKDMEAAMRAQEAANALAESAASSQARVTTQEQTAAQAVVETQAQQATVEQARAETAEKTQTLAQQAAEAAQTQQADALLLEQARRQQAYMAAHPEEEFAKPAPEPGEEGGEVAEGDEYAEAAAMEESAMDQGEGYDEGGGGEYEGGEEFVVGFDDLGNAVGVYDAVGTFHPYEW